MAGLVALGAVVVLTAPMAAAAEPVTTKNPFDRTFTSSCPQGYVLTERYVGLETRRQFSDGRQETQIRSTTYLSSSESDEVLVSTVAYMYAFGNETISVTGVTLRVTKPGDGLVATAVGRLVFDRQTGLVTFDSGPSDDTPNLCSLFNG